MTDADGVARVHVVALATLFPDASRPNFGIFVERSLVALARQPGISLTVVAPIGVPPWPMSRHPAYSATADVPMTEKWHNLPVHRPRFTLIPRIARRNATAVARAAHPVIARLKQRGEADVLSAQFFWPDGPAAAQIADDLGLPFSVKARGSDINLWGRHPKTADLVRDAAAQADGLLAVSQAMKDDMGLVGLATDKVEVHHTGLDADRFRPLDRGLARSHWGIAPGQRIVLSVGGLIARKGQDLVMQALTHLPDDVIYLLAGDGPDRAAYARLAQQIGVASRVRFLGPVANDELPVLYAAADVMALPSASEGLANAWVEALACGVPLVLGDIAPAHELLTGLPADAGRITMRTGEAIAMAISATLASLPDRDQLAARVRGRFDWESHGAQLARHLRRLAGK